MAVTYGFYDAINGDRTYTAEEMGSIFDGIINNGVLPDYESALAIGASSPAAMSITVAPGRAWFDHTWTHNDDTITLDVARSNASYPRIDIVVVETNKSTRVNSIKVVTGTAASNPVAPTPESTATVKQYVLAEVRVNAGATSIAAANITDKRGSDACPFASIVEHLEGRMVTSFNGQTGAITYTPPVDSSLSSSSTNPLQNKVVNTELGKKENTSNKVTSITSARTDTQYPSAKAVYTAVSAKENTSNKVTSLSSSSTNVQYPGAKLVYDQLALKANLASPTLTGTPKAPTAAAGTSTTQIATTAFVQNQIRTDDNLAPLVGTVLFNPSTMTTDELKRPFYYGTGHLYEYENGNSDTGERIVFKNKYCAGKRLKITWHADRPSKPSSEVSTNHIHFVVNHAALDTGIPGAWTSYYYQMVSISLPEDRMDIIEYGTAVQYNQSQTLYINIPSEHYPDSFVYLDFYLAVDYGYGSNKGIYIYFDKVEIVN